MAWQGMVWAIIPIATHTYLMIYGFFPFGYRAICLSIGKCALVANMVDPMKRSPLLQPLSREPHTMLTQAKACEQAALSGDKKKVGKTCQRAIHAFSNGLYPHFQFEEQSLLPLLLGEATPPLVKRTLANHHAHTA